VRNGCGFWKLGAVESSRHGIVVAFVGGERSFEDERVFIGPSTYLFPLSISGFGIAHGLLALFAVSLCIVPDILVARLICSTYLRFLKNSSWLLIVRVHPIL
jgi:hypothetical protein